MPSSEPPMINAAAPISTARRWAFSHRHVTTSDRSINAEIRPDIAIGGGGGSTASNTGSTTRVVTNASITPIAITAPKFTTIGRSSVANDAKPTAVVNEFKKHGIVSSL